MSAIEQENIRAFVEAAMEIGLAPKLAALIDEVEASIEFCASQVDVRYLRRLEGQLDRLHNPDLRLVSSVVMALCAERPERREVVQAAAARLSADHPPLCHLLDGLERMESS
jgi:hypothetical protein